MALFTPSNAQTIYRLCKIEYESWNEKHRLYLQFRIFSTTFPKTRYVGLGLEQAMKDLISFINLTLGCLDISIVLFTSCPIFLITEASISNDITHIVDYQGFDGILSDFHLALLGILWAHPQP